MATINLLPPLSPPISNKISPASKTPFGRKPKKLSSEIKASSTKMSEKRKDTTSDNEGIIDPASYRNTVFHNTSTAVLADGYHEAFTELFTLVEQQREEHRQAGPAAVLLSPLIDDQEDKLKYLVSRLCDSEAAKRREELNVVYMCQRDLALHFEETGDQWLADHFHSRCLETGSLITGDNRRKEGEAHLHVGLACENRGKFLDSVKHLLEFHGLSRIHKWHTESGERLHSIACEHLRRVYTKMAEDEQSFDAVIDHLTKAHELAKESGDTFQEGMASYRLGCAYERGQNYDKAIQSHKGFLERCRYHGDQVGVSKAYEALSRCHEMKGDIENAVKFLELYISVSEGTESEETVAKAYSEAGMMFNTLCDYEKAVHYFSKCYDICKNIGDKEAMKSARVHYGIAQTHYKLTSFSGTISEDSDIGIRRLINWKGRRTLTTSEPFHEEMKDESLGTEKTEVHNSNDKLDIINEVS